MGSGASSIGLNPSTMKVHPLFVELSELMEMANAVVRKNELFAHTLEGHEFNFCSVKIYFAYRNEKGEVVYKKTEWHVDVTNDKHGNPMKNNSQVPGTPVVIATFGDDKTLEFRKHSTSKDFKDATKLLFLQRNASVFVLHPDDEEINKYNNTHWRHKSEMLKKPENVTYAFMFRCFQRDVFVRLKDSTLEQPKMSLKKGLQFKKAEKCKTTLHYKEEELKLQAKMEKLFNRRITK
jgi:hypothetical protein